MAYLENTVTKATPLCRKFTCLLDGGEGSTRRTIMTNNVKPMMMGIFADSHCVLALQIQIRI